jgi:hypothetical protein
MPNIESRFGFVPNFPPEVGASQGTALELSNCRNAAVEILHDW